MSGLAAGQNKTKFGMSGSAAEQNNHKSHLLFLLTGNHVSKRMQAAVPLQRSSQDVVACNAQAKSRHDESEALAANSPNNGPSQANASPVTLCRRSHHRLSKEATHGTSNRSKGCTWLLEAW